MSESSPREGEGAVSSGLFRWIKGHVSEEGNRLRTVVGTAVGNVVFSYPVAFDLYSQVLRTMSKQGYEKLYKERYLFGI